MLTAVIWGVSFVSQHVGIEYIKPNTFNGIRTMIGVLVLIPFIFVRDKAGKSRPSDSKKLIIGGIVCGALLCAAGTLQTWGMVYTTSDKSGFITAMYMIFVPILYSGIMSCGVAYTLQIVGQQYAEPTTSSIILSLESVFAALAGWTILNETLTFREVLGCILMFAAIIIVQLPQKEKVKLPCDNDKFHYFLFS